MMINQKNYLAWKERFKHVMSDIGATASEELDLLMQYSGPEFNKQILSIKVAISGNLKRAPDHAWGRLDHRYGSPEKVERALKKKLSAIPKLTYKDKGKLFELFNTFAVKEEPKYSNFEVQS